MTMTLTDFLLARIAEDEGAALYAQTRDDLRPEDWGGWWLGHYQHYSRHHPARLIARCEADRRIMEGHRGWHVCPNLTDEGYTDYGDGSGDEWEPLCPTLASLALPYADHPDYRAEWRP